MGRSEQSALLEARIAAARDGEPSVVLVEGPPGIGKSSLVHRTLGAAPDVRVLEAAADAAETDVAWGVVDQLARSIGDGAVDELTAMVPIADSAAVGGWLLGRLGELDDAGPVALVVDDLPWADSLSIVALTFALRRLRLDRVLAVFTARSSDLHVLPQGVHQLVRGPHGTALRLGGLGVAEVAALSGSFGLDLPAQAVARLAEQTEGNPLHLTTLLGELPVSSLVAEPDRPLPAPASFRSLVLGKLATCSPQTEALVVAVAALGLRCPVADAAALAGIDDLLPPIDEAVGKDLLRLHDVAPSPTLAFAHPMVRSAVYNDLGPARRSELHRAAAAFAADPWSRLRHLVDASTGPDDALADELVEFAVGRRGVGQGGIADAGAAFRMAARVASAPSRREDLLLRALECLLAVGDAAGADELARHAAGFGDTARHRYVRGLLLAVRGSTEVDPAEAIALLESAWELNEHEFSEHELEGGGTSQHDPSLSAGIATQIAGLLVNHLRVDEVDEWVRRALDSGGTSVMSEPTIASALARSAAGRSDEALDLMPPVPEDGFDLHAIPRALGAGVAALWSEDPATARVQLTDAYEASRAFGAFFAATLAMIYLSDAEQRLGMLDDADRHAQLAASMAEDSDQPWFFSLSHANAAVCLALRGDPEHAARHVDAARAAAFLPAYVLWSEHAAGRAAMLSGDLDAARAAVAVLERDPRLDRGVIPVNPWHVLAVEVHLAAGETDAADGWIDRIQADVDQGAAADRPRTILSVDLWRLRGLRAAHDGRDDEAGRALARAVEVASRCPSPITVALAQLESGAHLRRAGQRRVAADHLGAAVDAFRRTGAHCYLERAERELAGCGLTPVKRSTQGTGQLTPQERTVAVLASRGGKNKEIAAELVVSPKTIEYHLGNIYRKLGVNNRAQLVAAFGSDGSVGETPGVR